ncbi:MAG: Double zinc ribbon [Candidatus Methanocomedens sp.]|nr:MAG: Double zinc ribbon [ANME-2 cluster archaeon]
MNGDIEIVTNNESKTRECPYCKEEILADAIKCKHCGSKLSPTMPSHEGTCPYCKEEIHREAIKCKHCQSILTTEVDCGCQRELDVLQRRFPSTLPKCHLEPRICGSSLPGYPPIICGYDYVCRYGGVDTIINSNVLAKSTKAAGSQQAMFAPIIPGVSDTASACNTVCLWFCPRDSMGGIEAGCFLNCLSRCSVFNSPGMTVFR